jgi:translation initiation factor 1
MAKQEKRTLGNIVYSTNKDKNFDLPEEETPTAEPKDQNLKVQISRKGRGGKTVTLVTGFRGSEEDLEALGKKLRNKCGTGGSAKDGEIILQGDVRDKVTGHLIAEGYKARKI